MSSQIKQVVDGRMGIEKSLRLHARFETAHSPLCQQIFNISVTEIEPEIEPHRILDDIGWKSMSFIGGGTNVHAGIVAQRQLIWQYACALPLCEKLCHCLERRYFRE